MNISALYRLSLIATAFSVLVATAAIGGATSDWVNKPFPGFFVLVNRVIPSVGLPSWSGSKDGSLYQRTVVAIDGQPVEEAADVYRYVEQRPAGSLLTYELRSSARTERIAVPSQLFSSTNFWAIFGAYLGTGLFYLLLGLIGAWCFPGLHFGRALFAVGTVGGLYGLSAVGIYGPTFHLRMHALAEAFLPTALAYLMLVFPNERRDYLRPGLAVASTFSFALAVPYQLLLTEPTAYSTMHAACETYLGIVGLLFTGNLIICCAGSPMPTFLLRAATFGATLGLGVPTIVVLVSGLSGGQLPVNVLTTTAFLFPLSVGLGIVRERSVESGLRFSSIARSSAAVKSPS